MGAEEMELGSPDHVQHSGVSSPARILRTTTPVRSASSRSRERPGSSAGAQCRSRSPPDRRARGRPARRRRSFRSPRAGRRWRPPHLVPVQAALPRRPHRERPRRPGVAGVEPAIGLEHGHPHSRVPSSIAQSSDDGPRSPGGPGWTIGTDTPTRSTPGSSSSGTDRRSARVVLADGGLHRRGGIDHRHLDLVAKLGQLDPGALRQSVVGGHQEQDARQPPRRSSS